ncbi:4'-phosphopantetheinyl transferase superfamily protein [Micromonospora sp. NPDC050686]|uniref:4'-phosphopantetheinyl transferase family protein n=1 Tax=Micromonospora sp. NPDC050686 TaxID=3154631 RepID=UPI0033C7EE89
MSAGTHVWQVAIGSGAGSGIDPERLLSAAEIERARHMRGTRRETYVLSHAAARLILAAHHGADPARIRWTDGRHGKPGMVHGASAGAGNPRSSRSSWSLSHSGRWAMVAVGGDAPIGVDVLDTSLVTRAERIARRYFTPDEVRQVERMSTASARRTACARLLSRREACVKAAGGTLFQSLKIDASRTGKVHGPHGALHGCRWHLLDLAGPPGYVAALAALDRSPVPVVQRLWSWPPKESWGGA